MRFILFWCWVIMAMALEPTASFGQRDSVPQIKDAPISEKGEPRGEVSLISNDSPVPPPNCKPLVDTLNVSEKPGLYMFSACPQHQSRGNDFDFYIVATPTNRSSSKNHWFHVTASSRSNYLDQFGTTQITWALDGHQGTDEIRVPLHHYPPRRILSLAVTSEAATFKPDQPPEMIVIDAGDAKDPSIVAISHLENMSLKVTALELEPPPPTANLLTAKLDTKISSQHPVTVEHDAPLSLEQILRR